MVNSFSEIDLNQIKGVLLDLDDTLYAYEPCHQKSLHACKTHAFEKYAMTVDVFEANFLLARKKVHDSLSNQGASHSRLLYFQKQHELIFGYTNPTYALSMEELYWNTFLSNMILDGEAKAFLIKLKTEKIKSCIITDLTAQIQMRKWLKLELGNYINFLVTSEEAGVEKPSAAIFELALEKLNLKASEVIMVGDNVEKDIKGAQSFGIKSFLVKAKTNS